MLLHLISIRSNIKPLINNLCLKWSPSLPLTQTHTHKPAPRNVFDVFAMGWGDMAEGRTKVRYGSDEDSILQGRSMFPDFPLTCPFLPTPFFSIGKYSLGSSEWKEHLCHGPAQISFYAKSCFLATESRDKWCLSYCQPGVQDPDSTFWDINNWLSLQTDMQAESFPFLWVQA